MKASDTLLAIAGLNREKRIIGSMRIAEENRPRLVFGFDFSHSLDRADVVSHSPDRSDSIEDQSQRNLQQRQLVESDKLRVALSMDDLTFRNRLLETGVLSTKDDTKWSFDILIELLEGPLRNPKRLDEAMRASKFMKRVLGYFQPLSFRYSDTRKDEVR